MFLALSGVLIMALPFVGDKVGTLSRLTPMGVALTFMAIGSIAFIFRWLAWQRSKSQAEMPKDQDTDLTA